MSCIYVGEGDVYFKVYTGMKYIVLVEEGSPFRCGSMTWVSSKVSW